MNVAITSILAKAKSLSWAYIWETRENMAQILLEEEAEVYVPAVKVFRDYIDHHPWKKKEEILVKTLYLLGSRACEVILKVTPYMLNHNMSKPYGQLLKWEFATYRKADEKEVKLLLVRAAVAKRKREKKGADEEETSPNQEITPATTLEQQPFKVPMRTVPIVCDPVAEPWCIDIVKWLQAQKGREDALRFNCTEMTVQNIVKKNLRDLDPNIHPHLLRHYRITHLIKAYDFTPYQITAFTGWSIKSTFGKMGIQASSNIDIYSHLKWQDYIDKLLVPLPEVL
jgi:hypothetical protein